MGKVVRRTLLGIAVLGLGAALLPLALTDETPAASSHEDTAGTSAVANDDPSFLQVYDANVENLFAPGDKCQGDWKDLLYYMRSQELAPDLYLVQQLSGSGDRRGDLEFLIGEMEDEFGLDYDGVVAQERPGKGPQGCAPQKGYQTNGIIYRADRFEKVRTDDNTWLAQSASSGSCRDSVQDRTMGVKVQLRDTIADATLTAATAHWPTDVSGGPPCADSNAAETAAELTADGYGGDQLILGGDMNLTDAKTPGGEDFRSWYKAMNGDLDGEHGFRDPVFAACSAAKDPGECRAGHWTRKTRTDRRIDFLFARNGNGDLPKVGDVRTPSFGEADAAAKRFAGEDDAELDYSDHRAVQARIHY